MSEQVVFRGRVERCIYDSENFKVYAINVDRDKYPKIKVSSYGNVIFKGDIHSLGDFQDYEITAEEQSDNRGYSYKVINIKKDKPNSEYDIRMFLNEILSSSQANVLWNTHPDIVDRVIENRLDDIDLNKMKGIKEYTFNLIKQKIIDNYVLVELVS